MSEKSIPTKTVRADELELGHIVIDLNGSQRTVRAVVPDLDQQHIWVGFHGDTSGSYQPDWLFVVRTDTATDAEFKDL